MAEGDFVDEGGGSFSRLVRISSVNTTIPISLTDSLTRQLGMIRITDDGTDYAEVRVGTSSSILPTHYGLLVINLNFVWDPGAGRWVPMTQP